LFGSAYLLAILSAVALSVVGVLVVARQQVFIGAAVANASTLGVALAWYVTLKTGLASGGGEEVLQLIFALLMAVGTAIWTMHAAQNHGERLSGDERTAAVFVSAAVLTVLLVANLPQGRDQIQRVQASTIIGAGGLDVVLSGLSAVGVLAAAFFFRGPLVLLISDAVMAAAVGMKVSRWGLAIAVVTGLLIGLSIGSTGFVFTFGALVLPVLAAKHLVSRISPLFWLTPVIAAVTVGLGLFFAFVWDLPPGQVSVAVMAATVLAARVYRLAMDRFSASG